MNLNTHLCVKIFYQVSISQIYFFFLTGFLMPQSHVATEAYYQPYMRSREKPEQNIYIKAATVWAASPLLTMQLLRINSLKKWFLVIFFSWHDLFFKVLPFIYNIHYVRYFPFLKNFWGFWYELKFSIQFFDCFYTKKSGK